MGRKDDCPPHDYFVQRTVKKGDATYTFYKCSKCGKGYMDIWRRK